MSFQQIVDTYFIRPFNIGRGYNVLNTSLMAFLFIALAYGTFYVLRRLKIKINRNFVTSFIPLILFGISVRVFEDAGILSGFWFITPGIWILFFAIIFSTLLVSIYIQKKINFPYYKTMFITGLVLFIPTLFAIQLKNVQGVIYILLFFLPIAFILKFVKWSTENKVVTAIHAFDAVATFVSIEFFNYREQHVLPNFVINLTGTAFSFIILKLVVIVSVLFLLDKYGDDIEFKNFMKFCIGMLGFVPGVRDTFRLIWFV